MKHTEEAGRLAGVIKRWGLGDTLECISEDEIAAIIDDKTGLPKLKAERDKLREVLEEGIRRGIFDQRWLAMAKAALAPAEPEE